MLVLLVPVVFGLMGFAVDLGRLYMVRGELQTAANAMALAGATRLIGTDDSVDKASTAAESTGLESSGFQNRYDYGGRPVGDSQGDFTSTVEEPEFFETATDATAGEQGAGNAGGTTAKHIRITVAADAPTLFWRFLPQAQEGRTQVRVQAVAGISAPLCTACGLDGIAIAALDSADTTHFGFTLATRYTLGYVCNGPNQPQPLAGATQRIPYLIYNRLNEEAEIFADEGTQVFRIGAGGLPASNVEARSCAVVNSVEAVWTAASPLACALPMQPQRVPALVTNYLCGLGMRFESTPVTGCESIAEVDTASQAFLADTDTTDVEDYAAYTGTGRRVITVAIVDALGDPQALTILGFRQFLIEPPANATNIDITDGNGRFNGLYIGSAMPLRQGRFSGCSITAGPGKVVLHR